MRISILLLPLLFSFSLQAQTPFAPVGAQWTYTQGSCCGPDSTVAVFQVLSDTMIQNRTCSNITTSAGWFGCYEVVHYISISNDSMYYFNEGHQQFHLLFRWNAVPGDTWYTPISQGTFTDTLDWVVSDTGHVNIGAVQLRTLTVSQDSRQGVLYCPLSGVITEQLGGSTPFTWIFAACDGETYNGLRCYEETIFPMPEPPPPPPISWLNPQYPHCELSTGVTELNAEHGCTISPSIVQAGQPFTITLRPGGDETHLRILDSSGRIAMDRTMHGPITIRLQQVGLYFVQMLGSGLPVAPQQLIVQ